MTLPVLHRRTNMRGRDNRDDDRQRTAHFRTLFDEINCAPHHLSANDVHARTAYVRAINEIVGNNFVADCNPLPKVKKANHDHFVWRDPRLAIPTYENKKGCADPNKIKLESTAEGIN